MLLCNMSIYFSYNIFENWVSVLICVSNTLPNVRSHTRAFVLDQI